jgi:nucleotide-binding universal stress UspA family protein
MDRVIVGIDGSDGARAALRWAAAAAEQWGVPLIAVWAWEFSPLVVATDAPVELDRLEDANRHRLHTVLTEELGEEGAARATAQLVEDSAVRALLSTAGPHDLLVVGSRGYGGFKGMLLGSVSQQVVHHAPCPVTVVRVPHNDDDVSG